MFSVSRRIYILENSFSLLYFYSEAFVLKLTGPPTPLKGVYFRKQIHLSDSIYAHNVKLIIIIIL